MFILSYALCVSAAVAFVMAQTYSGLPSNAPVSVTHIAAQAWHMCLYSHCVHADGSRMRAVAALVSSHARAKPSSGTETSGCTIMPHGVMTPRQLIQNELRPARQAIFSPGVPSHTSLSGARIPARIASARWQNTSSENRSRSQRTLQAAAS